MVLESKYILFALSESVLYINIQCLMIQKLLNGIKLLQKFIKNYIPTKSRSESFTEFMSFFIVHDIFVISLSIKVFFYLFINIFYSQLIFL